MKQLIACILAFLSALTIAVNTRAQTAESIWLTAGTTAYKTGETVLVTLNAATATAIQGFTFQISYDPACLRPVNASSPVAGMNGLQLPQLTGLVDGSYASTTPQVVNGVLAEVRFTALKGCQTGLTLESAALAIRNAEGFAVPLPGVLIGEQQVSLLIDAEAGVANPSQPDSGSILLLTPSDERDQGIPVWLIGLAIMLLAGFLLMLGAYRLGRSKNSRKKRNSLPASRLRKAALHIKHGPQAGKSYVLNNLPALIGRDPQNDICINDPYVISQHAQIYSERTGYYLRDLGGGTFINGRPVQSSTVALHPGDVVRLGKSVLFVFG